MIHTKEISERLLKMIARTTHMEWDDVSYGNDECDSIENSEYDIMIFLPNFTDFTSFTMMRASEYGMGSGKEYYNLRDLIRDINEIKQE